MSAEGVKELYLRSAEVLHNLLTTDICAKTQFKKSALYINFNSIKELYEASVI